MPEWLKKLLEVCYDNKEIVLAAAVAVIGDICFHWHNILIDAIKSKLLKKESNKSNYSLYKEGMERQRQKILQESLYIWENSEYENTKELYKKMYIRKVPVKNLGNGKRRLFFLRKNRGIAILGKAGVGKSTFLRYLFLKHTNIFFMFINRIRNRRYYFYKISEFIKDVKQMEYLENDSKNAKVKFVLLDGLDEINEADYVKVLQLIKRIYSLNYTILLSCRKDVYEIIKRIEPEIFALINYHCEIKEWTLDLSKQYVQKYAKLHPNSNIESLIMPYFDNSSYKDFFKTPLELSLLIYILEKGESLSLNENMLVNRADLYSRFLQNWIQREIIRRGDNKIDQEIDVNMVVTLWSVIAFELVKNSNRKLIDTNNSEIKKCIQKDRRLKKYIDGIVKTEYLNNRKRILGFSHMRITEYLAANYFCLQLGKFDDQIIETIMFEYTYPITAFIQERFCLLSHEELKKNFLNLITILLYTDPYRMGSTLLQYRQTINNNLKRKIRSLSESETRTIKNQIIYFTSRIPNIDGNLLNVGNEVIKEIYEKEQDKYNKRSAAIGATILGNSEIEMQYAYELLEDAESNLRDRSFTMVYYQDVKDKNPFEYIDDEIAQWDNSRKSRLERLNSNGEKSLRLRTFDLITIYNFTQSRRNSFVPTQSELDIVKNCKTDIASYCDEKKALLERVKENLIQLWESLM